MKKKYSKKMSTAIAMAESVRYLHLSLDELGEMCGIPSPVLEAAICRVSPEILPMRERLRIIPPIEDFGIKQKEGVRKSTFEKYAGSIRAYATSARSLQKICRENGVPYNSCRTFMMRYFPEAARRHIDILEGRFVVKQSSTNKFHDNCKIQTIHQIIYKYLNR